MKLNIITGGPGIGKTTLLNALEAKGYKYLPEAARELIEQGYNPLDKGFQEEIVNKQIEIEKQVGATFADRSLIDGVGYSRHYKNELPKNFPEGLENRYSKIFILDPLPNYVNDAVRRIPLEARAIHESVIQGYKDYGYNPIFVPATSVEDRVNFVLDNLKIEKERKFLLYENGVWFCDPINLEGGVSIRQGYLDPTNSGFDQIRLRQEGDKYYLTKKKGKGYIRREEEEVISQGVFESLWYLTEGRRVNKQRFEYKGFEIDKYLNRDLIVAEAEWRTLKMGKEVTNDDKYSNIKIAC